MECLFIYNAFIFIFKDFKVNIDIKMKDVLLYSLKSYYEKDNNLDRLLNIIKFKKKVSLRVIDWFATNYSKKNNIIYIIYKDDMGNKTLKQTDTIVSQFNVYNSYKSQLKAYSKKRFDPFCRRERIETLINNTYLNTTIGQLNFFRWIINNNVIDYIQENIIDIENDMNNSLKEIKKNYKKQNNSRKPRQEISKSAQKCLNKTPLKVSIVFD
tara:strand:+ start:404 stop:1039 length:636 start_codon:yes stop_codon:yes gene_type:complete